MFLNPGSMTLNPLVYTKYTVRLTMDFGHSSLNRVLVQDVERGIVIPDSNNLALSSKCLSKYCFVLLKKIPTTQSGYVYPPHAIGYMQLTVDITWKRRELSYI